MGRPTSTKTPTSDGYRDEHNRTNAVSISSAMSLDSTTYHHDYNENETEAQENTPLLPPYTDNPDDEPAPRISVSRSYIQAPLMHDTRIDERTILDHKGSRLVRLSPVLSTDPIALKSYLLDQAKQEVQAHIVVTGTHEATNRTEDNKTKKETVTDFSFYIDVSETVSRRRKGGECWSCLEVVGDERKTYRGGNVKRCGGRVGMGRDVEGAAGTQSLEEWCHLFCASHSALKTFTLRRVITGRDEDALRKGIEQIIRSTRYRGRVDIEFTTHIRTVSITTPHWINRLRTNRFVYWMCIILQLWILTWPALLLMTKRWDVVEVVFPFKQVGRDGSVEYVDQSEAEWCRKWKYSIGRACMGRLGQGTVRPVLLKYMEEIEDQVGKAGTAREAESSSAVSGRSAWFGRDGQDWGFDD